MFDDLEAAEQKFESDHPPLNNEKEPADTTWDESAPKDTWSNYSASGRLAPLLAGVTFCSLFFPFMHKPWGLAVATLAGYRMMVFALAFRDKNCSLRRPQVRDKLPLFAVMHLPVLAIVYGILAEWMHFASSMPDWLTVRGRKGSLYDWLLTAVLCLLAWGQEHWMRVVVKRSVTGSDLRSE